MLKQREWWTQALRQQREFEALLDRLEPPMVRKIIRSKNRFIKTVAEQYALTPDSLWMQAQETHRLELLAILTAAYQVIIPRSARHTLDAIRSLKADTFYDRFFERLIAQWIATNALEKAQTIASTTLNDIKSIIATGVVEAQGTALVARNIRKVQALSPWRAKMIARTELHGAATYAQEATANQASKDFGIKLMKFWIPTLDGRTRDAHASMSRHPGVELDQKFMVGGAPMSRPGDPSGGAANVINCRCQMVMREVEYDIN